MKMKTFSWALTSVNTTALVPTVLGSLCSSTLSLGQSGAPGTRNTPLRSNTPFQGALNVYTVTKLADSAVYGVPIFKCNCTLWTQANRKSIKQSTSYIWRWQLLTGSRSYESHQNLPFDDCMVLTSLTDTSKCLWSRLKESSASKDSTESHNTFCIRQNYQF